jgi:hypothetical protein
LPDLDIRPYFSKFPNFSPTFSGLKEIPSFLGFLETGHPVIGFYPHLYAHHFLPTNLCENRQAVVKILPKIGEKITTNVLRTVFHEA